MRQEKGADSAVAAVDRSIQDWLSREQAAVCFGYARTGDIVQLLHEIEMVSNLAKECAKAEVAAAADTEKKKERAAATYS